MELEFEQKNVKKNIQVAEVKFFGEMLSKTKLELGIFTKDTVEIELPGIEDYDYYQDSELDGWKELNKAS